MQVRLQYRSLQPPYLLRLLSLLRVGAAWAAGLLLDLRLLLLLGDVGAAQSRRIQSDDRPGLPLKQVAEARQAVVDGRYLFLQGVAFFHSRSAFLRPLSSLPQRLVVPIINEAVLEVSIVFGTASLPLPSGRGRVLEQCSGV